MALFFFSVPALKSHFGSWFLYDFLMLKNYMRNVSTIEIWGSNVVKMFELCILPFDAQETFISNEPHGAIYTLEAASSVFNVKGECLFPNIFIFSENSPRVTSLN